MRRLIGVEPEIIQRAPTNCVRVLVLRKRFRIPSNGTRSLSNTPWYAAVSSISLGAIVCPAWMLRRSVETDVAYINSSVQGHAKGLNSAVEVHVKQGILIVPYASRRVGYFVAHQPNAVVTRIRFNRIYCSARNCPRLDSSLRSDGRANSRKAEKGRPAGN